MAMTTRNVATAKKDARPQIKAPNQDPDPVGFGTKLTQKIAELQESYHAQLHAFLRVFLLVRLAPAVLRSIFAAVTEQGQPVDLDFRITFYPPDASGFIRAVGALLTPISDLTAEPFDDPNDPDYVDYPTIFGQTVRKHRPKGGWRNSGRRR